MSVKQWFALVGVLILAGCGDFTTGPPADLEQSPGFQKRIFHLEAPCTVNVEGVGMVDVEEEYLPGVVACENGNAPQAALEAQAVMARSFLYYKLFVAEADTIQNSQADQVYSCDHRPGGPGPEHYAAVDATRGQYLVWDDRIVAAFYVAAAIPPNPDANDPAGSCLGAGGNDPTDTEKWVTYNRGKSACDIDMTNLGWVPEDCNDNPHNRGCASQNGQSCLANLGWDYKQMLPYYYGDDIELTVATGTCGGPPIGETSEHDTFCQQAGEGSHCFDTDVRLDCAAGAASSVEECPHGCGDGACLAPPNMDACTGVADGAHCDGAARIECAGGELESATPCPQGCLEGACQESDDDDGTTDELPPDDHAYLDGAGLPPTVGPSPGTDGGCSVARGAETPAVLLLLGLVFGWTRRRR